MCTSFPLILLFISYSGGRLPVPIGGLRELEVDARERDGGQTERRPCMEEVLTMEAAEGDSQGGSYGHWLVP